MKSCTLTLILVSALAVTATAQQLELNDAGGSLQSNGADPVPGTPFTLSLTDSLSLEVAGAANSGFILVFGNLAAVSTPTGINGQFFDLDMGSAILVGDGIGGSPAGLPSAFFGTNVLGQANFSFPVTAALTNLTFAFEAIVSDPTQGMFPLNFTAAPEFFVSSLPAAVVLVGDDTAASFITNGPLNMYGINYNQISVASNGYIRFGVMDPNSDFTETTADFLAGTPNALPAAPMIALLWEDIDMGNAVPGQQVNIAETALGVVQVDYISADYFPADPFGNISITIDSSMGTTFITMDYTGYTGLTLPSEGIIGVSDGGTVGATPMEIDLVTAGAVNAYTALVSESTFQNFDGTGGTLAAEPFDLVTAGIVNFLDVTGLGSFTVF